jgi:polyferredoxin
MLRKIRIILAAVCFTLVTLLFLDFTGTVHAWLGWTAKIQFMPALMAVNVGVLIGLVVLTLLLGRVYCSVICPLGVFQDVISRIAAKRRKNRFRYLPALSWLRYGVLMVFAVAVVTGVVSFVALLSPYSAYGRIAYNLFTPVLQFGNNLLAYFSERAGNYAFYPVEVRIMSLATFGIAIITLAAIAVLAWRGGRTYCNTVCPIGTFLGLISRFAVLKPVINKEKCNGCKVCARNCKSSCIDSDSHSIDYSRCVSCMNCINKCKQKAISYRVQLRFAGKSEPAVNEEPVRLADEGVTRRKFFAFSALFGLTGLAAKAQQLQGDGGLAEIIDKQPPARPVAITPPGSCSARNMARHCTGCQLCVAVCPNHVLQPSGSFLTLMQPVMSYEYGYCRPECVKCTEVCPTHALQPLTTADKSALKIGTAQWVKELCVVITDKQPCDNCARHCPVQAITMIDNPDEPQTEQSGDGGFRWGAPPKKRLIPMIDTEKCIGCGACENLCPSRPLSAVWVEGIMMHRTV